MVHHIGAAIAVGGASVAAVGLLVAAGMKPDLDRRRDAVRRDWSEVSTALDRRATALDRLDRALDGHGARSIAQDGEAARARWSDARGHSLEAQIEAGNAVESATARTLALAATPAYAVDDAVARAAVDLRAAAPNAAAVKTLDEAIAHSNSVEDNAIRAVVAKVAGHHDLPSFVAAT